MDDGDPYGVSAVSGFYGPGAFISWVLILFSYLLDRAFHTEEPAHRPETGLPYNVDELLGEGSNEEERARLLAFSERVHAELAVSRTKALKNRLDLSLVSTCVYPIVAAGNMLYYMPVIWYGSIDQDKAARISAPLLVLRLFHLFGSVLLFATCKTGASISTPGKPRRKPFFTTIMFIISVDSLVFRAGTFEKRYSGVDGMVLQIIWLTFLPFFILFFAASVLHGFIKVGSGKRLAAFVFVALTWLLVLLVETIIDARYINLYWFTGTTHPLPDDRERRAFESLNAAYFLLSTGSLVSSGALTPTKARENSAKVFHLLDAIRSAQNATNSTASYFEPRGQIVERDIGILSRTGWSLMAARASYSWSRWLYVTTILATGLTGAVIMHIDDADCLPDSSIVFVAFICIYAVYFLFQHCWHDFAFHLMDLMFRPLAVLFKPDKFVPATTVKMTDLDQIVALLLNGLLPLGYTMWKAAWKHKRVFRPLRTMLEGCMLIFRRRLYSKLISTLESVHVK